jgi:cytochrome c-type biogenesis protein CcmE
MKPRHKRLAIIVVGVAGLVTAGLLITNAFRSNLVYFFSPTEVLEGKAPVNELFRLGGMVEKNSVRKSGKDLEVEFIVTDMNKSIPVQYRGILPDLFREGQGVVVQGKLDADKRFVAREVLAKHDEKYMPPEAAKALQQGSYRPGETKKQ